MKAVGGQSVCDEVGAGISLVSAANNNRGLIVTVPTAGYVSADDDGTVDETEVAPSARWHEVGQRFRPW